MMNASRTNDISKKIPLAFSSLFFIVYFLFKPYYFFESGSIQPGDCFLLLAFGFYILEKKKIVTKEEKLMAVFLLLVLMINSIYFCIYGASQFLKSSLYYIFNFFAIVVFRDSMKSKKFLSALNISCKVNIWMQLIIFLLHKGSYWAGTYRYMGTYKDPNQMGFAIISTICIMYLLDCKRWYLYICIALYLIIQTYSGGMLLAFALLIGFDMFFFIKQIDEFKLKKKHLILALVVIVCLVILLLTNTEITINFKRFRLEEKVNSGKSIIQTFIEDRDLEIMTEHPEFFLFGYGEGFDFFRFGRKGEMHSTWISLCFYYGILPFCILIRWIYKNVKNVKIHYYAVYLAIFLEAFTLINHRQPAFWMIILLANNCKKEENCFVNKHNCTSI